MIGSDDDSLFCPGGELSRAAIRDSMCSIVPMSSQEKSGRPNCVYADSVAFAVAKGLGLLQ